MSRGTWVSTTIHAAEVQEREAAHYDSPTIGTRCTFVQSAPSISQKAMTVSSQVSRTAVGMVGALPSAGKKSENASLNRSSSDTGVKRTDRQQTTGSESCPSRFLALGPQARNYPSLGLPCALGMTTVPVT